MAVGWSFATQLVDTVCMFLCISICNDTSEQHQSDDTYLQSFGISGIYTAVVYSSMAVPVNSGRDYTTMYRTHTVATLLLLSGNRLKRAHILHIPADKHDKPDGTALPAVCSAGVATDEYHSLLASLIGLITPYWLYAGWMLFKNPMNPWQALEFTNHFTQLRLDVDYQVVTRAQLIYFVLLVVLFIIGSIHFWLTSYMDKVRVRQIYTSLMIIAVYTIILLAFYPQRFDILIYVMTIAVSPIAAHFVSLTYTRMSNIFFITLLTAILILTGMNLWIS